MEAEEFKTWRQDLQRNCFFFDGASKGNPGVAGGGGIILSPGEQIRIEFSWGLGEGTNNQTEALALWQGLLQLERNGITDVLIFGDSQILIKALISSVDIKDMKLKQLLSRIKRRLTNFRKVEFYHILRSNNKEADQAANQAVTLRKGELLLNKEVSSWVPLP
jgi:ribonuclease HI